MHKRLFSGPWINERRKKGKKKEKVEEVKKKKKSLSNVQVAPRHYSWMARKMKLGKAERRFKEEVERNRHENVPTASRHLHALNGCSVVTLLYPVPGPIQAHPPWWFAGYLVRAP